jgi:hypothetical protein
MTRIALLFFATAAACPLQVVTMHVTSPNVEA